MHRRHALAGLAALTTLAACGAPAGRIGPDGLPKPTVYRIKASDTDDIQFRMLDSVNALRAAAGVPPVELNAALTAASMTQARDMQAQNRPWLFGSDGSSPLERAQRAGFTGQLMGENISESYETELETLAAWMEQPDTRRVVLDPAARYMGLGWSQESAGKIWWSMTMGSATAGIMTTGFTPAITR